MSLQRGPVGKCDGAPGAAPQWDQCVWGLVTSKWGCGLLVPAEVLTGGGGALPPRESHSTPTPKRVLKTTVIFSVPSAVAAGAGPEPTPSSHRGTPGSLRLGPWCVGRGNRPPAPPAEQRVWRSPEWPWAAGCRACIPVAAARGKLPDVSLPICGGGGSLGTAQTRKAVSPLWKVGLPEPRRYAVCLSSVDSDWGTV